MWPARGAMSVSKDPVTGCSWRHRTGSMRSSWTSSPWSSSNRGARMTEPDLDFFAPPAPPLLRTPSHRVIAVVPGPDEAMASLSDLTEAGFPRDDIYVICGEAGVRRIDPSGKHHGLHGR